MARTIKGNAANTAGLNALHIPDFKNLREDSDDANVGPKAKPVQKHDRATMG
ncbi:hypothetical protein KUW09_08045 [Mameliella alba]|nr:hypothetical protein [Antarctobacter heliothermus]MBY6143987.1 hypothetical protein [Mameliella alba]